MHAQQSCSARLCVPVRAAMQSLHSHLFFVCCCQCVLIICLQLLYQHVRLYLPATSLGSSQRGGAQTAAEFRQAAEQSLVPILLELLQALTPATKYGGGMDGAARGAFGGVNGGAADSQSLTLYGGGASQALVLSTGTASRLAPSGTDVSNSTAFLTAMLQRILKHITG